METDISDLIGTVPDAREALRMALRLLAALAVGALIGYQRERIGKAAGLRTHMLVALGTALFVMVAVNNGMAHDAVSRVVQGVATGVGFLGAGVILKLEQQQRISGLTSAASIWITAAASVAAGLGELIIALTSALLAWMVLALLLPMERRSRKLLGAPGNKESA